MNRITILYPSCPNCWTQFVAPLPGKKFDQICRNFGVELSLRCSYCDTHYTPRRWVFTSENRQGNSFCSRRCKKRAKAEQISKEKAAIRAELFKPRQCARNGVPAARDPKYRIDCPVVFRPRRVKQIFCSEGCKDVACYHSDPEQKRNYANKSYAADPDRFREYARKRRKRKIRRLGIELVRATERRQYPQKKARRAKRQAEAIEKLVQERLAESARQHETRPRITLAACLSLKGMTKRRMSKILYPKQRIEDVAYNNTKKFFGRFSRHIESEKRRINVLPESVCQAEAQRAQEKLNQ